MLDRDWYTKTYPWVEQEIQRGLCSSAQEHFDNIGVRRGYLPYATGPRFGGSQILRDEGVWLDHAPLSSKPLPPDIAETLTVFERDGYVILPQAVPPPIAEAAAASLTDIYEGRSARAKFSPARFKDGWSKDVLSNPAKTLDAHVFSAPLRHAIFHPKVIRILRAIFEQPMIASQSLGFWRGSGQPIHQDTAYVTYCKPKQFVGVWTALQDVEPNSGELEYVVGSHKVPPYLFKDLHLSVHEARRVQPELDQKVASTHYQEDLKAAERRHKLERRRFLPKRGDVLIWAALLAHGGSKISLERTRKSIVTHFCPDKIVPTYFERRPRQIIRHNEDVSYMSQHYEGSVGFVEEHVF